MPETNQIPAHLQTDRYWRPLLFLFSEHSKLKQVFTTKYFDMKSETIKVTSLKRTAAPWSQSEKFMLYLALHCYNDSNKVNLGDMDSLDDNNSDLALTALQMRYGR
jgi:hypothetical protein